MLLLHTIMVTTLYHRSTDERSSFQSNTVYWAATTPASEIYGSNLYQVKVYLPRRGEEDYIYNWDIDNLEPEWLWGRDDKEQFCFRGALVYEYTKVN